MNTGIFGEGFPYSNFHDLNMDWIIKIAKDFLDQYTHIQETIANGEESLQTLTDSGLEQLQNKADSLEALLQEWYNTHSEDIADQLANAINDLNTWYTTHEGYLDQYVTSSINTFNTSAEQKGAEVIASIPSDYTSLSEQVDNNSATIIDLAKTSGIIPITEYNDGYYNLSSNYDSADISNITPNQYYKCAYLAVTEGDTFTYNGTGESAPRPYGFIDSNGNILSRGRAGTYTDLIITAPKDAVYVLFNVNNTEPFYIYKNVSSDSRLKKLEISFNVGLAGKDFKYRTKEFSSCQKL